MGVEATCVTGELMITRVPAPIIRSDSAVRVMILGALTAYTLFADKLKVRFDPTSHEYCVQDVTDVWPSDEEVMKCVRAAREAEAKRESEA